MRKQIIENIIFSISFLFILSAANCNRTDIRGAGKIISETEVFKVGKNYNLQLKIPDKLEGKVFKSMWFITPQDAGKINYKRNKIFSPEAINFKEDRLATISPVKAGKILIDVYMIYHGQSSPQRIASKEFLVKE